MDSFIISLFVLTLMVLTPDGQINRYINPAWLEMDANSEYYPGGAVISQILRAYGLGDNYNEPSRPFARYRNGYGRSYPRNRIANSLNNVYDSDPLTQEYLDHNDDYVDNTIRVSNRYRYNMIDIPNPRRTRLNLVPAVSRNSYYSSDYMDRDLPQQPYPRSRLVAASEPGMTQESVLRGRDMARLVPRSTVAPDSNEKRKIQ